MPRMTYIAAPTTGASQSSPIHPTAARVFFLMQDDVQRPENRKYKQQYAEQAGAHSIGSQLNVGISVRAAVARRQEGQ